MKWNLDIVDYWTNFLATEHVAEWLHDDTVDKLLKCVDVISEAKHLEMPFSWVNRLFLSNEQFDERFPNKQKVVHYKRIIYERFSSFANKTGLIKRISRFSDLDYSIELRRWEWFEARRDCLASTEFDCMQNVVVENYTKGRKDFLKSNFVYTFLCGCFSIFKFHF